MGVMRFAVHPAELVANWPEAYRAYITGLDGRAYPTRAEWDANVLSCRRSHSDSGKLHVIWPVRGHGRPVVTTTALPERDTPYLLTLELARGKLSEIRDQCAAWEQLRMAIPSEYRDQQKTAFRYFVEAMAVQADPQRASALADQALSGAFDAAEVLAKSYATQRLSSQRAFSSHPPALLGCRLDAGLSNPDSCQLFLEAFNSGVVPIEWRRIEPVEGKYEWTRLDEIVACCSGQRMIVRGGPLIDLSPHGMPEWLQQWEHDFLNLQSFVCDFVDTAVTRYMGQIRLWEVSACGNSGGALGMSEEHCLALVARTLETASRTDSNAQLFTRVDQPWGEYMARGQHRLSPFQFVDTLVRSNVGLTGVNLEIAIGYSPRGSLSRDLLSFSKLIDHWSLLGVQLHVTLALPSASGPDPHAYPDLEVDYPVWKGDWTEETQAQWIDQYLPMLIAKPAVTAVYWTHFHDANPHLYPHAGLVRTDGSPKPALAVIQAQQHAGRR